ncbi:MAG: alpha-ketoacid dehydrogenase subunit beta [Candidatus Methanomethyliaceae archaeon]|nr:alpha-ketoacid dehydrogenase subunit beta [Candidatus Methanomethyliaceae archaeon]
MREVTYSYAINETLHQLMQKDERVVLIGQGVTSPWYVGTTTVGLISRFGEERVIDPPVSENCTTGVAIGLAFTGMRPIYVFPRMDFMYYAMDQIANHAANWYFMFGGQLNVPMTIWAIINRGGEQAAQHSQAIHAIFAHIPGLKVVAPSNGYDAKGLLVSCVNDGNPVIFVDDRWLYNLKCNVPEELYSIPIGKGIFRKRGDDVTIIASSYMVHEAILAAEECEERGINVDVIDLRSIKPIDFDLISQSVKRTKRIVIVDGGWKTCGLSAEIAAKIAESELIKNLKAPLIRVTLPDVPAPASSSLEQIYYPRKEKIVSTVQKIMEV